MPRPFRPSTILPRRLAQQRLIGTPCASAAEVVRWLGAVQAQDYAAAKWAIAQRSASTTDAAVEQLFNEGKILRTHVLRPTWHFVAPEDIRWLLQLTAPRVRAQLASHDRKLEVTAKLVARSEAMLAKALRGGNFLTREEIAAELDRERIVAGGQRLGHLLMHAELGALVCSGPRRGKQATYALLDERVAAAVKFERAAAVAELARRYFASHGPATLSDFAWWSGLTMADARAGVHDAELREETIDGRVWWSGEVMTVVAKQERSAHLLPNYDEWVVGLHDRSGICTPDVAEKFSPTANGAGGLLGNVVVVDGWIAGEWRRSESRARVRVEVRLHVRLSAAAKTAVRRAAARFAEFLGREFEFAEVTAWS